MWFPVEPNHFPTTTLVINLVGSALIGVVLVLFLDRRPPRLVTHSFLGTGILGAFTTFSTFAAELAGLVNDRRYGMLVQWTASMVIGGGVVAAIGIAVGRAW